MGAVQCAAKHSRAKQPGCCCALRCCCSAPFCLLLLAAAVRWRSTLQPAAPASLLCTCKKKHKLCSVETVPQLSPQKSLLLNFSMHKFLAKWDAKEANLAAAAFLPTTCFQVSLRRQSGRLPAQVYFNPATQTNAENY